jgi:hypothetical protein
VHEEIKKQLAIQHEYELKNVELKNALVSCLKKSILNNTPYFRKVKTPITLLMLCSERNVVAATCLIRPEYVLTCFMHHKP